jgi:hypothetical protein
VFAVGVLLCGRAQGRVRWLACAWSKESQSGEAELWIVIVPAMATLIGNK